MVSNVLQIAEVRQFFASSKKQYEEQAQKVQASKADVDTTTMLLFGSVKAPSKSEILASFPSRYITDMLIARYFHNRSHTPGNCTLLPESRGPIVRYVANEIQMFFMSRRFKKM